MAAVLVAALALTACSASVAGSGVAATGATRPSSGTPSSSGSGPSATTSTTSSTSATTGSAAGGSPTAAGSAGSSAAVPAGLEKFYSAKLDWASCAALATSEETKSYKSASLQCADLTVPLAYDDPTGATITLKVLRKPATSSADRIGSVVINPGGPGGSGVEYASYIGAYGIGSDLNKSLDLVGFDPRGVGFSQPAVRCQTDAERDASRALTSRTRTQEEIDAANAATEKIAQGCAALTGQEQGVDGAKFLANVGTRDVAKDLDVLRAVLGDTQLTYIGWSYGTSIGTAYAEQFPNNVRAMILDGAIDPQADPAAELVGQGEGFQKAFEDYAAHCAKQPQCALGTDPSKATAAYQGLVRPLLDTPLRLADGRVITFSDANTGTSQALYAESLWKPLDSALLELSKGNGTALMGLADTYDGRDSSGKYSNTLDAFLAIGCIDGSRTVDPALLDQLAAKYAAAAPFQDSGDPPKGLKDPCDFWPVPPTSSPHVPKVDGLPRILVISTTKDPATPYQAGVNLAKALGAALLTVDGTNHTAYLGIGNSCVDDLGTAYLTTLKLPGGDTTCQ